MAKMFKFYMQNSAGLYYAADSQMRVYTTANKTPLKFSPMNWKEITPKYGRNLTRFGVFRKMTENVQFCGDGKAILREIYFGGNGTNTGTKYESYCKVTIERRNTGPTNLGVYQSFYSAEVDFTKEPSDTENYFSVTLLEQGLHAVLDAKAYTPYEISLSDGVDVNLNGVNIYCDYLLKTADLSASGLSIPDGNGLVIPMYLSKKEGEEYFKELFPFRDQTMQVYGLGGTPLGLNSFVLPRIGFASTYTFTAEMVINSTGSGNIVEVQLLKVNPLTSATSFTSLYLSPTYTSTQSISVNSTTSFNFDANFNYYIVIVPSHGVGGSVSTALIEQCELNVVFHEKVPITVAKAKRYSVVVAEMISAMSNGLYTISSTELTKQVTSISNLSKLGMHDNLPSVTYLTSGYAISNQSNPVIKTTFNELMQDMWSRWGIGYTIENNVLKLEKIDQFFDSGTTIATLGSVANLERTTATDLLIGQIHCGYGDTETEKINGRYEVNSEQWYKMPVNRVSEEANMISPFCASVYKIEELRSVIFSETTRDRKEDNSTFLLEVNINSIAANGAYNLLRWNSADIGNVPSPATIYNIGLSPHRFVLRHLPYLRSLLDVPNLSNNTNHVISFQKGLKNVVMTTSMGGVITKENHDIVASQPQAGMPVTKLFSPIYYNFDAPTDENLYNAIQAKPFGTLRFYDYIGKVWTNGFIIDAGVKMGTKDVYKFKLLAAPNSSF